MAISVYVESLGETPKVIFDNDPNGNSKCETMKIQASRSSDGIVTVDGWGVDGKDFDEWSDTVRFVPPTGMDAFVVDIASLKRGVFEVLDESGKEVEEYKSTSRW